MSVPVKECTELKRHELLADVVDRAAHILKKRGMSESEAQTVADEIVDYMVDGWGGQYITIPKDIAREKAELYESIKAEFDGTNQQALATKHHLSINAIHRILELKHP